MVLLDVELTCNPGIYVREPRHIGFGTLSPLESTIIVMELGSLGNRLAFIAIHHSGCVDRRARARHLGPIFEALVHHRLPLHLVRVLPTLLSAAAHSGKNVDEHG